jgi:hypothetical protein
MSKESISECVKAGQILSEIRQNRFQPIPKGWFSVDQYMEAHDCGRSFAFESLGTLVKFNKVEHKKWPCRGVAGKMHYISIYKNK